MTDTEVFEKFVKENEEEMKNFPDRQFAICDKTGDLVFKSDNIEVFEVYIRNYSGPKTLMAFSGSIILPTFFSFKYNF